MDHDLETIGVSDQGAHHMKRTISLLIAVILLVAVSWTGSVREAEAVDVTVTATIANAITQGAVVNLAFGTITADPAGDTITVDCTTTATGVTGNAPVVTIAGASTLGGAVTAGEIQLITTSTGIDVGITAADITLTGPGAAMAFANIPAYSSGGNGATGGTVVTAGANLFFYIGGQLTINASQTAGAYTGTIVVTLNYP